MMVVYWVTLAIVGLAFPYVDGWHAVLNILPGSQAIIGIPNYHRGPHCWDCGHPTYCARCYVEDSDGNKLAVK